MSKKTQKITHAKMVAQHATQSEKMSWNRKRKNIELLTTRQVKIQNKIWDLQLEQAPLVDEITNIRKDMVDTCIHPEDLLVEKEEGYVECKFCFKKLRTINPSV
jgi:hypothetical protein